MTDQEFWLAIRRSYLAIAALIEKRYLEPAEHPPRSAEEPRVASRRHR